jgi:putative acetyltransferase
MSALRIRHDVPADHARVYAIQRAAFGRSAEADLVNALRSVHPQLSLVAELDGELVGHVFLSPVSIGDPGTQALAAGALAPIGVLPDRQGQGIGSTLVRRALEESHRIGWRAVFLVGEPLFYARFGFTLAAARDLHYESADFDPVFQVCELERAALGGCRGRVEFAQAFASMGVS